MDKDRLRRWPRSRAGRRLLVTLAVMGGLLVVIRLVLDPIAAFFTRKALNQSPDFSGAFADVHVTIFPPGYEIARLKIIQHPGGNWKAPLVYAERSRIDILWRKLLRGHAVANVWVDAPKLRIPSRQEKKTVEKTRTIGQRLEEMFPVRVDRVDIDRGEILLASGSGRNAAELWIHD